MLHHEVGHDGLLVLGKQVPFMIGAAIGGGETACSGGSW